MINKQKPLSFRPRARILQMLGEQLIGNSRLAIFELVKNAYDADARNVEIFFKDMNTDNMSIQIIDDGIGMTFDTIEKIWLVPAHDHQEKKRNEKKRTALGRLPLGEKGLGRFAVHKLGNKIELVTKNKDVETEVLVDIDWEEQIKKEFLSDTEVYVIERTPKKFIGPKHGTMITITELKDKEWTRRDVRQLYRQILSINSPFSQDTDKDFKTSVYFEGYQHWIEDMPNIDKIMSFAPWHAKFQLKTNGKLDLQYYFQGVPNLTVAPREQISKDVQLFLSPKHLDREITKNIPLNENILEGIGPISGEMYIYDLDNKVLNKTGYKTIIKDYLKDNGGIRIYRDGIRVYNYGEKNDDWLGLDIRRVNVPGVRISRNIVLGAIELEHEYSTNLIEKTNREGFDENTTYNIFRAIILAIITQIEAERLVDKERLNKALLPIQDREAEKVDKPIQVILQKLDKYGELKKEIAPLLKKVEKNFHETQSIMLNQGLTNMGIGIIFHEIEHGVKSLAIFVEESDDLTEVKARVYELSKILDTFSELVKSRENEKVSLKVLFKSIRNILKMRFRAHQIHFICPFLDESVPDITIKGSRRILTGIINNIFDNSIYWLQVKWPNITTDQNLIRKVYFNAILEHDNLVITVGDNGTGFLDSPEQIIKPFFTRKNEGMGIGLHFVHIAMEMMGGNIEFDNYGDYAPSEIDGAIINLIFNKNIVLKEN